MGSSPTLEPRSECLCKASKAASARCALPWPQLPAPPFLPLLNMLAPGTATPCSARLQAALATGGDDLIW